MSAGRMAGGGRISVGDGSGGGVPDNAVPASLLDFRFPVRVYYEDTDAAGIVYYANYLRFMERARSEWLRKAGHDIAELARSRQILFAVRSVRIDYRRPARLSDLLEVAVRPVWRRRVSFAVAQEIRRDGTLLCQGEVTLACLHATTFAPRALPEFLNIGPDAWKTP
jgi:acyl-CoA thioester hydrolase